MITQIKKIRSTQSDGQDPVTERIIGHCFRVHRTLGPGFPEKVYQAALFMELEKMRFQVQRERAYNVLFENEPVGQFHVDLLVDKSVIVEVKAVTGPMPTVFSAQLLAYLKAAQLPVGLLVNFGNPSCQVKRVVLSSAKSSFRPASYSGESAKSPI